MTGNKKMMGETGAGIDAEDEIDMTEENTFTNKWGTYFLLPAPLY